MPKPKLIHKLLVDDSGVEMVQFALVLPVLLTLGLGGIELANFGIANLRVSQIAVTTADNAGRVRDQISEADIEEVVTGAKFVGNSMKFAANGRIILSDVEPTTDGTKQWIRWQRCDGALNVKSSYGVPLDGSSNEITDFSQATSTTSAKNALKDYGALQTKTSLTATGMGPAGNQVATAPGTALMFVEVVYNYQPIVSNIWLGPQVIRATSAFNVRQRTDQNLKTGGLPYTAYATCNYFNA